LTKDDVSYSKLADLIEKDTVVAGNILKMVNSAMYGRRGTVNSVRHGLSMLGMDKLRNAVLGMSITRMWNQVRMPGSWSMARFNLHSAATAILSDQLAQRIKVQYPEGAFVAGLFHDIGQLLVALGLPGEYERILSLYGSGERPYIDCEREILGVTHAELSASAVTTWNLPEPIQTAILFHHDPKADPTQTGPGVTPLSSVIDAAHQYVNSIGVGIRLKNGTDAADPTGLASFFTDSARLDTLLAEFKLEYDSMAQFFH